MGIGGYILYHQWSVKCMLFTLPYNSIHCELNYIHGQLFSLAAGARGIRVSNPCRVVL